MAASKEHFAEPEIAHLPETSQISANALIHPLTSHSSAR
jgi:hypothetical protein